MKVRRGAMIYTKKDREFGTVKEIEYIPAGTRDAYKFTVEFEDRKIMTVYARQFLV